MGQSKHINPIVLNLSFKVKNPHHENVCEFTTRILVIINKRKKHDEPFILHGLFLWFEIM